MTLSHVSTKNICAINFPCYPRDTYAFVDIDDTLLAEISTSLFTDQGKRTYDNHASKHPSPSSEERYQKGKDLAASRKMPIESDTVSTLKILESKVAALFILTARFSIAAHLTFEQLSGHMCAPSVKFSHLNGPYRTEAGRPYLVQDHIIYTNGGSKALVLDHFLKTHGLPRRSLVFVDNCPDHIAEVARLFPVPKRLSLYHYIRTENHRISLGDWPLMLHIQAKLLLHRSHLINDVAVGILITNVRDANQMKKLLAAIDSESDDALLQQLIDTYGERKEVLKAAFAEDD